MVGLEKFIMFSPSIYFKKLFINFNSQLARGLSSPLGGGVCLLLKTNKNT